jgi:membrane-associated protease RseP (regulator of RpoE activity)
MKFTTTLAAAIAISVAVTCLFCESTDSPTTPAVGTVAAPVSALEPSPLDLLWLPSEPEPTLVATYGDVEIQWVAPEAAAEPPTSLMQELGLRPGDRVVAIDGQAVGDLPAETLGPVLAGWSGRGTVSLTVERDGQQLELAHTPN